MKQLRFNWQELFIRSTILFLILLLLPFFGLSQKTIVIDSTEPGYRTVISGPYDRGGFYQFLWGKHYRKEWTTPVKVPVINLDTIKGGLIPLEKGGGRQTQTLRLRDKNGKQYVLRSVDKDYRAALPEIVAGTFIEDLAKDQVSTAHPFASVTVPIMIDAAGVFHTNPQIVYVPYTPGLGQYNETFAGLLCLFEERPDEDQSDAPHFGFSKDVKSTESMLEDIYSKNDHRVVQEAFVRARLFDMFLGDWGRHDDQWRWAEFDSADFKIYKPIPRDRDQTYTLFEGFLLKLLFSVEELENLSSFSHKIRNIKKFNFPARYIDRQLTNEVPEQTWIDIAKDLQQRLTDYVIERSVRQMPPELFAISGEEIISKLKSRRNDLPHYAEKYYMHISKEVDIVGSKQDELFEINKINNNELQLNIYDLNKENLPKKDPFYSRTFRRDETEEIRLYGLDGNDIYRIQGDGNNKITIRIIGGIQKDSVSNHTAAKVKYYDNPGNIVSGNVKSNLSADTTINAFNYYAFKPNVGHTIKFPSFSNVRGIFFNLGYSYRKQGWRKIPFSWEQTLRFNYSIFNNSFGGDYTGIFNQVIGKWNLLLNASYDQRLQNFFYGVGNETINTGNNRYYDVFTEEGRGSLGLNKIIGPHSITLSGNFESVKVEDKPGKFVSDNIPFNNASVFNRKNFAGIQLNYSYYNVNDRVVPTKGIGFSLLAGHTRNLKQNDRSFERYGATFGFYLPISTTISIATKNGASTVSGETEFYQMNWLGGGATLRGYRRMRFYGRTVFYNNTELRWITNTKSYLFNGKIGLIGFVDNGRVWSDNEKSEKWHMGYGGGLLLAPFNRMAATVYYGISEEDRRIHVRLAKFF